MRVTAHLYDPKIKRKFVVKDTTDWDDFETAVYCWFDGNFSCDCNRKMFIEDSVNKEIYSDYECGNIIIIEKLVDDMTGHEIL